MKMLPPLLALLLTPLLMAPSCNPPPPGANAYCNGNDYSISNNIEYGYETDGVTGAFSAILNGDPSDDPRSTVQVTFGQAYCTGVVLTPTVVLTAGHCGYAPTTMHTVKVFERGQSVSTAMAQGEPRTVSQATGLPPTKPGEPTFAFNTGGLAAADGALVLVAQVTDVSHTVHPDYLKYVNTGNLEDRKADMMILHLASALPDTVTPVKAFYDPAKAATFCNGLISQGFGQHETSGLDLRETKYVITNTSDPKYLTSRASDIPQGQESGRICFGDSGGPLYADVAGVPELAGITTTTMSQDCLVGGTHVNVDYPAFHAWIEAQI